MKIFNAIKSRLGLILLLFMSVLTVLGLSFAMFFINTYFKNKTYTFQLCIFLYCPILFILVILFCMSNLTIIKENYKQILEIRKGMLICTIIIAILSCIAITNSEDIKNESQNRTEQVSEKNTAKYKNRDKHKQSKANKNSNKLLEKTEKFIEKNIEIIISSTSLISIIASMFSNFLHPSFLSIQIWEAPIYQNFLTLYVPYTSKEFTLNLHNYSKKKVHVTFLGICRSKDFKNILNSEDWDRELFYANKQKANLISSPSELTTVSPKSSSSVQTINISELWNKLNKDTSEKRGTLKLCAVYYAEDNPQNNSLNSKHFTIKKAKSNK